jgi:hypothetical protein
MSEEAKMRNLQHLRSSLVFASTLSVAGCSAFVPFVSARNACTTTAECGAQAECVESRCVARQSSTWAVLSATPASTNQQRSFAATTLPQQELRGSSAVDITLARAREVRGVVRAPEGASAPLVNAVVRFVRSDAAADAPVVEQFSSASADESAQGFSVFLAEGQYDVFVEPRPNSSMMGAADSLPPLVLRRALTVDFRTDPSHPQAFSISYSGALEVSGFIVDRDAGAGVGDLLVRIVDEKGAALSTRGQTATGSGAFRLGLALQSPDQQWSLEISSAETTATTGSVGASARAVYRIERDALVTSRVLTGLQVRIAGLNRLARTADGTCVGCVPVEASVERAVRTVDEPAGLVASVYMHGTLTDLPPGHHAWFQSYARSDARGAFVASVLPGDYQVSITPEDDMYALTLSTLRVATMLRGRTFSVPLKPEVRGVVRTALSTSMPMSLTEIEAIPLNEPAAAGEAPVPAARARSGRTDSEGEFSLRLDPGRYLIVARPSIASGFAAALTAQPVVVSTTTATPPVSIVVGAPISLRGRVLAPNRTDPVEAASVQAFARVPYTLLSGSASRIDVSVFSAETDENGAFEVLLPAGLPQSN